jgi:hypothetical protein
MDQEVYFNCYLTNDNREKTVCTFKIIVTNDKPYPFHLYKLGNIVLDQWHQLSIYNSMSNAIRTLLNDLFSTDIVKAIQCGQLTLNTQTILKKILNGKMSISIATVDHREMPVREFDFILEELIENRVESIL